MTRPMLQDFRITGSGPFPCCGSTGCFRAIHKPDGTPVLLHRFRPAAAVLERRPIIKADYQPLFSRPFVTRITGAFEAAGSAYLVEPLPECVSLSEVWRCLLLESPESASGFVLAMLEQVAALCAGWKHGSLHPSEMCAAHVVLTRRGIYGLLASCLPCESGSRILRSNGSAHLSPSAPADQAVCATLAGLLDELLGQELAMASSRGSVPLLAPGQRQAIEAMISNLSHTVLEVHP